MAKKVVKSKGSKGAKKRVSVIIGGGPKPKKKDKPKKTK